jgi:hypothetical protein
MKQTYRKINDGIRCGTARVGIVHSKHLEEIGNVLEARGI